MKAIEIKLVEDLKSAQKTVNKLLPLRNRALVQEAALGELNYTKLGKKYGITKQRVRQILDKFHIRIDTQVGLLKHRKALEKQSASMMGKNVKVKKKVDLEKIMKGI